MSWKAASPGTAKRAARAETSFPHPLDVLWCGGLWARTWKPWLNIVSNLPARDVSDACHPTQVRNNSGFYECGIRSAECGIDRRTLPRAAECRALSMRACVSVACSAAHFLADASGSDTREPRPFCSLIRHLDFVIRHSDFVIRHCATSLQSSDSAAFIKDCRANSYQKCSNSLCLPRIPVLGLSCWKFGSVVLILRFGGRLCRM